MKKKSIAGQEKLVVKVTLIEQSQPLALPPFLLFSFFFFLPSCITVKFLRIYIKSENARERDSL